MKETEDKNGYALPGNARSAVTPFHAPSKNDISSTTGLWRAPPFLESTATIFPAGETSDTTVAADASPRSTVYENKPILRESRITKKKKATHPLQPPWRRNSKVSSTRSADRSKPVAVRKARKHCGQPKQTVPERLGFVSVGIPAGTGGKSNRS